MESSSKINNILSQDIVIGGHSAPIYALHPCEENFLYSGAGDRFLAKWNLTTGLQEKFSIQFESSVFTILTIDHLLIAGLSNGNIHIIDTKANKEIRLLKMSNASVHSLTMSKDKQFLFATSADSKLGIWKIPTFEDVQMIQFSSGKIRSTLIDGNLIYLGCQTGEIRVLDFKQLKEKARFQAHDDSVNVMRLHPSKPVLVSGGKDGHVRLFNLDEYKEVLSIPAHNFSIYGLNFVNNYMVTASMDKTIKVWDASQMELLQRIDHKSDGHSRSVNALVYHPVRKQLYSSGDDQRIIAWDFQD